MVDNQKNSDALLYIVLGAGTNYPNELQEIPAFCHEHANNLRIISIDKTFEENQVVKRLSNGTEFHIERIAEDLSKPEICDDIYNLVKKHIESGSKVAILDTTGTFAISHALVGVVSDFAAKPNFHAFHQVYGFGTAARYDTQAFALLAQTTLEMSGGRTPRESYIKRWDYEESFKDILEIAPKEEEQKNLRFHKIAGENEEAEFYGKILSWNFLSETKPEMPDDEPPYYKPNSTNNTVISLEKPSIIAKTNEEIAQISKSQSNVSLEIEGRKDINITSAPIEEAPKEMLHSAPSVTEAQTTIPTPTAEADYNRHQLKDLYARFKQNSLRVGVKKVCQKIIPKNILSANLSLPKIDWNLKGRKLASRTRI